MFLRCSRILRPTSRAGYEVRSAAAAKPRVRIPNAWIGLTNACGAGRRSDATGSRRTSRHRGPRDAPPDTAKIASVIDPSVVRGLEYYTGPVFEAELTFETPGEDGKPVRFGSVGGGGRYDGLVARFRAEPVPATGFSIGVSRLLAALRAIKSPIVAAAEAPGPVVVLALDRDAASMANTQRLVASLARRGNRRRTLSRAGRHERAAQICRQAREPLRRHPGLERARRAGRPAGDDPRSQARRRARQGDQGPRRLSRAPPARSSFRARGAISSSACARCSRGSEATLRAAETVRKSCG